MNNEQIKELLSQSAELITGGDSWMGISDESFLITDILVNTFSELTVPESHVKSSLGIGFDLDEISVLFERIQKRRRRLHKFLEGILYNEETVADRLHEAYNTIDVVETVISDAYKKYEPEIYKKLDFKIGADWYDNSIEIYFLISLPYPYEPCAEIRKEIYALGFDIVYWNFTKDVMSVTCDRIIGKKSVLMEDSQDEIRGWEPRHNKYAHWEHTDYGYVDWRFNEDEWVKQYGDKK